MRHRTVMGNNCYSRATPTSYRSPSKITIARAVARSRNRVETNAEIFTESDVSRGDSTHGSGGGCIHSAVRSGSRCMSEGRGYHMSREGATLRTWTGGRMCTVGHVVFVERVSGGADYRTPRLLAVRNGSASRAEIFVRERFAPAFFPPRHQRRFDARAMAGGWTPSWDTSVGVRVFLATLRVDVYCCGDAWTLRRLRECFEKRPFYVVRAFRGGGRDRWARGVCAEDWHLE